MKMAPQQTVPHTQATESTPSILVVDDEESIRSLLRQILERAGYRVVEASNGKQALRSYSVAPTDLVIMDILMPEHEGLETIKVLRRSSPDVRILAITGGVIGLFDSLEAAKMFGAVGTLLKPIAPHTLLETVRNLLKLRTPLES